MMSLTPWRKRTWHPIVRMHGDMEQVFDDFFGKRPAFLSADYRRWDWRPPVDISDTDDAVEVRAEMPGLSEKDINVTVKDNVLTLKGEKKHESDVKEENYHRHERAYGRFQRSFALPTNLETDNAKATFKDGVLTLSIPKSEQAKPKEISVSAE